MSLAAHPVARALLSLAGLAVVLSANREQAGWACAVMICAFVTTRQTQLGFRLARVFVPLILVSGALWLFVYTGGRETFRSALEELFRDGSPFLLFDRALVGSSAIVLAWATTADGEAVVLLRWLGVPPSLAFLLASGGVMATSISEGQAKSLTALRAQGVIGPSILSRLRGISRIVSLTWTAALSTVITRAECVWAGNGFVQRLDPSRLPPRAVSVADSLMLAGTALMLVLIVSWRV